MSEPAGLIGAMRLVVRRELTLAWRRWDEVTQPLIATTPELAVLRTVGGGVVWVAALLSSLLALESVFRSDVEDGTMEQWVLSGQPLAWLLLAKVVAHWLMTGLPLVLVSPAVAAALGLPGSVWPVLVTWQRAPVLAGAASGDAAPGFRCTVRGTVARRAIGGRAAAAARGDVLSGVEPRSTRNVGSDEDKCRRLTPSGTGRLQRNVDLDTQARLAAACLSHPRAARAMARLGRADSHPRGCVLGARACARRLPAG